MASMKGKGKGPKLSDMSAMDDKKKIIPMPLPKGKKPKKKGGCK